jgi:ubiquinone/menaquinone biosynthesis C-methylase UbiE
VTIDGKSTFLSGEGDQWYLRNKVALDRFKPDLGTNLIIRVLGPIGNSISNILEIGCSNGIKVEFLANEFDAAGFGLDPSIMAVDEGNARVNSRNLNQVQLTVGTADDLPFEDLKFDLVVFGFCLYLVDRDKLSDAILEANRVLKKGGFLVITDFDPGSPTRVPYHHKDGVFSHKDDYSSYFLESGSYYLVAKESYSHSSEVFTVDTMERVSTTVLFKENENF